MKKVLIYCILCLCLLLTACTDRNVENIDKNVNENNISGDNLANDSNLDIVTSFYPIYIATSNIVDGVENVTLSNMTNTSVGCLHDYQLTTRDMNILEKSDVFIINGLRNGVLFR